MNFAVIHRQSIALLHIVAFMAAAAGCTTRASDSDACPWECDPITETSITCEGGSSLRYCAEVIACGSSGEWGGEWRTDTCEALCLRTSIRDATDLAFDHCGGQLTDVIDGPGNCWCRNLATDELTLGGWW